MTSTHTVTPPPLHTATHISCTWHAEMTFSERCSSEWRMLPCEVTWHSALLPGEMRYWTALMCLIPQGAIQMQAAELCVV